MATRKLIVEIVGDSRSLERTFGKVESRSEKFNRRLRTGAKAGLIGAGIGATAIVTQQLKESVDAAVEAEKAQTRLKGAFKSSHATQKDFARAQKEISRVSKEAALDDEDLSDSLALLTRTTGSAQKGLRGMALAANIARARGISLAAATKIVEKAHVGQLRGLKSVGVQLDKNTSTSEALDRAQRKFAGSAQQYGDTAAAANERLSVAFENLQETIGTKLLPLLQRVAIRLTAIVEDVEKNWPQIEKVIQDSVRVIRPAIQVIVAQIKGVANIIAGVVKTVKAIKDGDWKAAWDGIVQVAVDGVFAIVKAILTLPVKVLAALGSAAFNGLRKIGTTIKDAALSGLEGLADAIVGKVQDAINKLIGLLNKAIGALNKVPILPDVPKIPLVGANAGRPNSSTRAGAPGGRVQFAGAAGMFQPFVIETNVNMDSDRVGRAVTKQQQKQQRRNPKQKRGPNTFNADR